MKAIAGAVNAFFSSFFLAAVLSGVLIFMSAAWEGLSAIPIWIRWIAIAVAVVTVRTPSSIAICATTWIGAGICGGMPHVLGGYSASDTLPFNLPEIAILASQVILVGGTVIVALDYYFVHRPVQPPSPETIAVRLADEARFRFFEQLKRDGLSQEQRELVMRAYNGQGPDAAAVVAFEYRRSGAR